MLWFEILEILERNAPDCMSVAEIISEITKRRECSVNGVRAILLKLYIKHPEVYRVEIKQSSNIRGAYIVYKYKIMR